MARNMWTFIDRELAKLEQQTSGDPYVGAMQEARKAAEYHNRRKAERSEDAMKIMAATAGNYNTNYDNAALDRDIKRLKNYMAKNSGSFDETAVDYYDVTLNKMKDQKALNLDFKSYQERLPGEVEKMNEYLKGRDKDQVWTAENVNELKEMQAPLARFLGDFKAKHGDRLATKSYEDYNLQLNNMKSMDSFLIQSALDDGHLDEQEATSFIIDLEQGNTKASDRYKKLEDVKIGSQIQTLTQKMTNQMAEVDMLKKFWSGDGTMLINAEGRYDPNGEYSVKLDQYLYNQAADVPLVGEQREQKLGNLYQLIHSKIDALDLIDKSYQKITTKGSYVDQTSPGLLDKISLKKKKVDKKLTAGQKKVSEIKTFKKEKEDYKTARETASDEYLHKSRDFIQNPQTGLGYGLKDPLLKGMAEEGLIKKSDYSRWMTQGVPIKTWTNEQISYMDKFINAKVDNLKNRDPGRALQLLEGFQAFKKARANKLQYMEWNEKAQRYVKKKKK